MFFTKEQFSSIAQNQLNAQLNYLNAVSEKMFEDLDKVVRLNRLTSKAILDDSKASTERFLSTASRDGLISAWGGQLMVTPQKSGEIIRQISEIISDENNSGTATNTIQTTPNDSATFHAAQASGPDTGNIQQAHTPAPAYDAAEMSADHKFSESPKQAAKEIQKKFKTVSSQLIQNVENPEQSAASTVRVNH